MSQSKPARRAKQNAIGRRDFFKVGAGVTAAGVLGVKDSAAQSSPRGKSYAESQTNLPAGTPRPWNVPQRQIPPTSIDVHTHWAPADYLKAKADYGQPDQAQPADLASRTKWMDAHGVQMFVLTLGGFMPWQWVSPEQGAHIAQLVNDDAIAGHAAFPDRYVAGIELPVGDPVGSLKELNRVGGKPGLVCVHIPNSLAGRDYIFEPGFGAVLARVEELGLPLLIHPLDGEPNWYAGHRLADASSGIDPNAPPSRFPGLTNSVGETFEQATTVSKFIVTGTLDKYPDLQIIIAHAGGAFPYIVGRLDHGTGGNQLKRPVVEYIRRFYFDSLTFYPVTLQYLIDLVGIDRVVLGTDSMVGAPIPPGAANGAPVAGPHSVIDQLTLSENDRDLLLRGNLKRLFKL
jgi:aminocarboxymuconate-semialdehyde decarboxylase